MTAKHLQRGTAAEALAREWLEQRGLRFVEANFRCKLGELDLIMMDGECLVVIEVRYRYRPSHGGPLASVTRAKQQKILRTARLYLQRHRQLRACPLRFDVLALQGPLDNAVADWRKRAFDADS